MTPEPRETTTWPTVTVVVPAYNEERFLGRCLASLAALDYPADRVEVVVVDNGSTDATVSIAEAAGARVEIIPDVKVGEVRNGGVARSAGEIVAFIDADCVAPPTWLRAGVAELLADPGTGATGGTYLVEDDATWLERVWASPPGRARQPVPYLPAGTLMLRRALFEELGGFATGLSAGEDEDLCRRIRDRGLQIVSLPESAVYHLGFPDTLGDVFRRQRWQGSNQLESARSPLDLAVLSVHGFALGLLAAVALALLGAGLPAAAAAAASLVALPVAAGLRREGVARTPGERLARPFQLWLIMLFYFLGRTAGLIINYRNRLTRSDRKQFK